MKPDWTIRNAWIADGSGSPLTLGSLSVSQGRISYMGPQAPAAEQEVDAQGRVLCPGLLDVHTHADAYVLAHPDREIKLRQGVTCEIMGNCGFSAAPVTPRHKKVYAAYSSPILGAFEPRWNRFLQYLDAVAQLPLCGRVAALMGAGTLRVALKGFDGAPLTCQEWDELSAALREGFAAGAVGLSLGLMYAPELHWTTEELARLAQAVQQEDRVLTVHLRGEGALLLSSVREMLSVARQSGVKLHISHFKAAGRRHWGSLRQALALLEEARAQGVDVSFDAYPYTAGATTLTSLFPPWTLENGIQGALELLAQPDGRKRLMDDWQVEQADWDNTICSTGWQAVVISDAPHTPEAEGRAVPEWAEEQGLTPAEAAIALFHRNEGQVGIVIFHMNEDEMHAAIAHPMGFVASDSIYAGRHHPRLWGSFAQALGPLVRQGVITLPQAIYKTTAGPAARFGLPIGRLEVGAPADLMLFDAATMDDRATYSQPDQPPAGIQAVWVGGRLALQDGRLYAAPGGLLRV